jgi:squalene-hopene/tetraprenyl-beta-curcumene cyclase
MIDLSRLDSAISRLSDRLRDRRVAGGHWEGHLASSALSTGTAILALHLAEPCRPTLSGSADRDALKDAVEAGRRWLVDHQNADGGWGDTVRSRSNISTTAIVWAVLATLGESEPASRASIARASDWLRQCGQPS